MVKENVSLKAATNVPKDVLGFVLGTEVGEDANMKDARKEREINTYVPRMVAGDVATLNFALNLLLAEDALVRPMEGGGDVKTNLAPRVHNLAQIIGKLQHFYIIF